MALSAQFHNDNRKYVQKSLKPREVFVIAAHARMQRSADTNFFAQNRDFYYLTGINEPDWVLAITADTEFLIQPQRSKVEIIFDGQTDLDEISRHSGVKLVLQSKTGWQELSEHIAQAKEVQVSSPEQGGSVQVNPAQQKLMRKIRARTKAPIVSIHPYLHQRRAIKQAEEIKRIQKAIDITADALAVARNELESYKNEREVSAELTGQFLKNGADGHAYDPIVASGLNACTLHYVLNNQAIKKGDVLLLDVGAEHELYASDITRTWSVGKASDRQKDIHAAVDEVRQHAIATIRPGVRFKDYFDAVERFMGLKLQDLGLIKVVNTPNIRRYFPHGVSHMMGLDVHDVSPGDDTFQPGMVLTVEPGIYVPEEAIGVRIEDDILVTAKGTKNLSENIPHEL